MLVVSTGCGLTSTNTRNPCSASTRVASAKRTCWRRLRYQYSASTASVIQAPSTVEYHAVSGALDAAPTNSARTASTWLVCEA